MYIKNLTLQRVRGFENVTFELGGDCGVYLLAGINGAGKSTALDALVILMSRVLRTLGITQVQGTNFERDDIRLGHNDLNASIIFTLEKQLVECSLNRYKDPNIVVSNELRNSVTKLSERPAFSINKKLMQAAARLEDSAPLVVYFSPRRSVLKFAKKSSRDEAKDTTPKQGKRPASAYDKALTHRELNIEDFIMWWENVDKVKEGQPLRPSQRDALNKTINNFLSEFSDIETFKKGKSTLRITKNKQKLKIEQLSDGERSVLAFVLELTRRLSLANPNLANPAQEGRAIVLIDEIDLHLHPVWQRDIIHLLNSNFKNCQFIATTHSPQSIGEVKGTHINIISGPNDVKLAGQAFGMDSNWILDVLMKAEIQNADITLKEEKAIQLIRNKDFTAAKALLLELREEVGRGKESISRAESAIERHERMQELAKNDKNK